MLNTFDNTIVSFLNELARQAWTFNSIVVSVATTRLFKGTVLVPLLWWLWFRSDANKNRTREVILTTIGACYVATGVSQFLQVICPFRSRPLYTPELALHLPYTMSLTDVSDSSSFPSDHAILFFALGVGLLIVSRVVGAAALAYVVLATCLPRIYVGLHFPTDIIAGAFIGGGIAYFAGISATVRRIIRGHVLKWEQNNAGMFYACLFVLTYEIAILFDDVNVIRYALHLILA
ncbi:MAG: phosphatase PAP2 family protein [Nitrospiraceae bacterium]|nr:MAG: phosphatase PAP2 family protein [Nitrospiraceae bacterium]